ncbi:hypothetical protein COBT_002161, partial [Conglomerata obtusa]
RIVNSNRVHKEAKNEPDTLSVGLKIFNVNFFRLVDQIEQFNDAIKKILHLNFCIGAEPKFTMSLSFNFDFSFYQSYITNLQSAIKNNLHRFDKYQIYYIEKSLENVSLQIKMVSECHIKLLKYVDLQKNNLIETEKTSNSPIDARILRTNELIEYRFFNYDISINEIVAINWFIKGVLNYKRADNFLFPSKITYKENIVANYNLFCIEFSVTNLNFYPLNNYTILCETFTKYLSITDVTNLHQFFIDRKNKKFFCWYKSISKTEESVNQDYATEGYLNCLYCLLEKIHASYGTFVNVLESSTCITKHSRRYYVLNKFEKKLINFLCIDIDAFKKNIINFTHFILQDNEIYHSFSFDGLKNHIDTFNQHFIFVDSLLSYYTQAIDINEKSVVYFQFIYILKIYNLFFQLNDSNFIVKINALIPTDLNNNNQLNHFKKTNLSSVEFQMVSTISIINIIKDTIQKFHTYVRVISEQKTIIKSFKKISRHFIKHLKIYIDNHENGFFNRREFGLVKLYSSICKIYIEAIILLHKIKTLEEKYAVTIENPASNEKFEIDIKDSYLYNPKIYEMHELYCRDFRYFNLQLIKLYSELLAYFAVDKDTEYTIFARPTDTL